MEASTTIPTPSARPPREMVLTVRPKSLISPKLATRLSGMETATTRVFETLRRKSSSTRTASTEPIAAPR